MKDEEALDFLERQMIGCRADNKNKFADAIQWALENYHELEEVREKLSTKEKEIEDLIETIKDLEQEVFEGRGVY